MLPSFHETNRRGNNRAAAAWQQNRFQIVAVGVEWWGRGADEGNPAPASRAAPRAVILPRSVTSSPSSSSTPRSVSASSLPTPSDAEAPTDAEITFAAQARETLLAIATDGAQIAAKAFRSRRSTSHRAAKKSGFEIVTEVDLEVERFVRERLLGATSLGSVVVIGEEDGASGFAPATPSGEADEGTNEPLLAFVDPIDGTTNFAHGHPFFCMSIGLWRGTRPVAGAVVAPMLGLSWSASVGGPALRNEETIRVTDTDRLEDALLATGFPYDRRTSEDDNLLAFSYLKKRVQGLRRCGSAAIDLCLVADGTYDGYWERKLMPWDAAAGVLIAAAAGATITDDHGEPFSLLPSSSLPISASNLSIERVHVLVANPALHPVIRDALGAASRRTG